MHLQNGDPKPHIDPTHHTLIAYRFCPYVERVRLALSYHNIEHDVVFVSLRSKPDWFLELYPTGKVPLLLTKDGKAIPESIDIVRYLDGLSSSDMSLLRTHDEDKFKEILKAADKLSFLSYAIYKDSMDFDLDAFKKVCRELNDLIKGPFSMGTEISMTDLLIFPICNRLEVLFAKLANQSGDSIKEVTLEKPLPGDCMKLTEFLVNMRKEPFVDKVRDNVEAHAKYQATFLLGLPNPDI